MHPQAKRPLWAFFALIIGIIAAIIGAVSYAALVYYVPFIYLNAIFCVALGGVVGFSVTLGGRLGHLRNTFIYGVIALLCGVIAIYISWLAYLSLVLSDGIGLENIEIFSEMVTNPPELWEIITKINEKGLWSLNKLTVSGVALWVVWAIEIATIIFFSIRLGISATYTPYSEIKGLWMKEENITSPLTYIDDPKSMKETVETGLLSVLLNIQSSQNTESFSRLSWFYHPEDEFAYISLKNIKKVMKKKQLEEESQVVFERLRVPFLQAKQLTDRIRSTVLTG